LIQVPLENKIKTLYISVKDENKDNKNVANIQINNNENYFYFHNLNFDTQPNDFICLNEDYFLNEYLNYFFNENNIGFENYQKSLINSIDIYFKNEYNNKSKKFELNPLLALEYFQSCKKVKIEPNLDNIDLSN